MANNEEKVAIVKSPCYIHNKKTIFKNAITRAEAVERMAGALCHRHCPEKVCTSSCNEWEKYGTKEDAEAALDALLGKEAKNGI